MKIACQNCLYEFEDTPVCPDCGYDNGPLPPPDPEALVDDEPTLITSTLKPQTLETDATVIAPLPNHIQESLRLLRHQKTTIEPAPERLPPPAPPDENGQEEDSQQDKQENGQQDEQENGQQDEQEDGQQDEQEDGQQDEQEDGQQDEQEDGQQDEQEDALSSDAPDIDGDTHTDPDLEALEGTSARAEKDLPSEDPTPTQHDDLPNDEVQNKASHVPDSATFPQTADIAEPTRVVTMLELHPDSDTSADSLPNSHHASTRDEEILDAPKASTSVPPISGDTGEVLQAPQPNSKQSSIPSILNRPVFNLFDESPVPSSVSGQQEPKAEPVPFALPPHSPTLTRLLVLLCLIILGVYAEHFIHANPTLYAHEAANRPGFQQLRQGDIRISEPQMSRITTLSGQQLMVLRGHAANEGPVAINQLRVVATIKDAAGQELIRSQSPLGINLTPEELQEVHSKSDIARLFKKHSQMSEGSSYQLNPSAHSTYFIVLYPAPPLTSDQHYLLAISQVPASWEKPSPPARNSPTTGPTLQKEKPKKNKDPQPDSKTQTKESKKEPGKRKSAKRKAPMLGL
jgi:hypothetical protein